MTCIYTLFLHAKKTFENQILDKDVPLKLDDDLLFLEGAPFQQ